MELLMDLGEGENKGDNGESEEQNVLTMEVDVDNSKDKGTTAVVVEIPQDIISLRDELISLPSGSKFLTAVLDSSNFKNFCKLILLLHSHPSSSDSESWSEIVSKLEKSCKKLNRQEEKRGSFVEQHSSSFSCDGEVFKTFLKNGMKEAKDGEVGGWMLISILRQVFSLASIDGDIQNPILGIQMILSHSKAAEIFLEFHRLKGVKGNRNVEGPKIDSLEHCKIKVELLKLWRTLVQSFCGISKEQGSEGDKKILENSVTYLMQMYGATLGGDDKVIFSILELYASKKLRIELESLPVFGPRCFDERPKSNPLYAHSVKANAVLGCISDTKAFDTAINFDEEKFLNKEQDSMEDNRYYDIRFLLPLICHVLDEKNVCDVLRVVSNGWIHFIARGLGLNDARLRNIALLSFKRLILGLQLAKGFRVQDVRIWLHFLLAMKNGFVQLQQCGLTPLLATWMVATCEVLMQPGHQLYSRVTHFLLAKPTIDLSILPDFTHFFNAEDGNRQSREWIMNILVGGLKTKEDWIIARKVPTIKFLCSIFHMENISMQRTILKILANGANIPDVAQDLIHRHGLLMWMAHVKIDSKTYYKRELEDIYRNLVNSCSYDEDADVMFKFVASRHSWEYIPKDSLARIN